GAKTVGWIPCSNWTSERRAMNNPLEFLTGADRYDAMGSEGKTLFQKMRSFLPQTDPFARFDTQKQREVAAMCLPYFIRHHIIKPLIVIEKFREAIIGELFGFNVVEFSRVVDYVQQVHLSSKSASFDNVILEVDKAYNKRMHERLETLLQSLPDELIDALPQGIAFHCHGDEGVS
ncbi:MAG: hypothetical protein K8S00_03555, partial [Bacteroidales bacterium]|nr:hypothetical protein [Bacteroidales bacterium]